MKSGALAAPAEREKEFSVLIDSTAARSYKEEEGRQSSRFAFLFASLFSVCLAGKFILQWKCLL